MILMLLSDSSIRFRCEDFHSIRHTSHSAVNFSQTDTFGGERFSFKPLTHFKGLALVDEMSEVCFAYWRCDSYLSALFYPFYFTKNVVAYYSTV